MSDHNPLWVGMEFEGVMLLRDNVINSIRSIKGVSNAITHVTRDASVESPIRFIGENSILFLGNKLLAAGRDDRETVSGYEIVTAPLSMENMRLVIMQVVNIQKKMGEIYSPRSSIHTHTGFPNGLIFLKSAIAMGLKVEPLFYKIAGMGNTFRGEENNAAYCRPLALPPAIRLRGVENRMAVLNPLACLDSYGLNEFWARLGIRSDCRDRYTPLRYFGLNVFSILLRGTLEFRYSNYCAVSRYVEAVTRLYQFVSNLIIKAPLSDILAIPQISIFTRNPDDEYTYLIKLLVDMASFYETEVSINDDDLNNILELVSITPQPVFSKDIVRTHIKTETLCLAEAKDYGLTIVDIDDTIEAGIIDIHTFNTTSRSLI